MIQELKNVISDSIDGRHGRVIIKAINNLIESIEVKVIIKGQKNSIESNLIESSEGSEKVIINNKVIINKFN